MLNADILLTCAQLANLAYWEERKAKEWSEKIGCSWFIFFENTETDAQAIAVHYRDHWIITYRGTTSLQDALTDLDYTLHTLDPEYHDLRLHRGFYLAATSLPEINTLLRDIIISARPTRKPPTFIFNGHSLGGAMAQIAAILMTITRGMVPADVFVTTFGSPMVTNPETARRQRPWLSGLTMFEIDGDPVPTLPGASLGYQHFNQRQLITLPNRGILTPDHPISGYIEAVVEMSKEGAL